MRTKTTRAALCGWCARRARGAGGCDVVGTDLEVDRPEPETHRLGRDALAGGDGTSDDPRPRPAPLDPGDVVRLGRGRGDTRQERGHRGRDHPGLAERREDLLDVAQERVGRADQQHTGAGHPLAVGVEEVGGTVQCHGRLAGSRAALDHEHTLDVGPDDLVLLRLDRRDDVLHPAGAVLAERGHEGALAGQRAAMVGVECVGVEHVVLDPDDAPVAGREMTTTHDAGRVRCGGLVERAGRRGAPVGEDRGVLLVGQADPADVARAAVVLGVVGALRARGEVEPAEDELVLDGVVGGEAVGVHRGERVALGP
ncbi:hypothetical protein [Salana multivorans]